MKNYLKVFRVRHLVDETEGGGKELPVEHFVFFDDASDLDVKRAINKATLAIADLERKHMRPKVCAFHRVQGYPTIQPIIGE